HAVSISTTSVPALLSLAYFFFFQAEDGIRDRTVTGVQTCALPISPALYARARVERVDDAPPEDVPCDRRRGKEEVPYDRRRGDRSEERRVGKECRSRWSTYD